MPDVKEELAVAVHETTRRLQKFRGDKQVDPAWKRTTPEQRADRAGTVQDILDGHDVDTSADGQLANAIVRIFQDAVEPDAGPDPTIIGPDSDANVLETAEGTFDQADVDG